MSNFSAFSPAELRILARLNAPKKIQDFLHRLPINFEQRGDTCLSPREVLRQRKAHCAEGAIFAAAALWYHGHRPLLLDLKTTPNDDEHVVALFRQDGRWGAISKTNHAVLRFREPVYKTVRELAMSFFHEYFKNSGQKTMRSFSRPFDLAKIKDRGWLTTEDNLWDLTDALDSSPHYQILTKRQIENLRKADEVEIKAGKIVEWRPGKNSE